MHPYNPAILIKNGKVSVAWADSVRVPSRLCRSSEQECMQRAVPPVSLAYICMIVLYRFKI